MGAAATVTEDAKGRKLREKTSAWAPLWAKKEGGACLGWRFGVSAPVAMSPYKSMTFQYIETLEAPAGGQAGAARRNRRAGHIRDVAFYTNGPCH